MVPAANSGAKMVDIAIFEIRQVTFDLVDFIIELLEFGQEMIEIVEDLRCEQLCLFIIEQHRISQMKGHVEEYFLGSRKPKLVVAQRTASAAGLKMILSSHHL